MGVYKELLGIDDEAVNKLTDYGLMPPRSRRNLSIYAHFMNECKKWSKEQAYINTADHFLLSYQCVKKIILSLKKCID